MSIVTYMTCFLLSRVAVVLSAIVNLSVGNSIWTMTTNEWFYVVYSAFDATERYLIGLTHRG